MLKSFQASCGEEHGFHFNSFATFEPASCALTISCTRQMHCVVPEREFLDSSPISPSLYTPIAATQLPCQRPTSIDTAQRLAWCLSLSCTASGSMSAERNTWLLWKTTRHAVPIKQLSLHMAPWWEVEPRMQVSHRARRYVIWSLLRDHNSSKPALHACRCIAKGTRWYWTYGRTIVMIRCAIQAWMLLSFGARRRNMYSVRLGCLRERRYWKSTSHEPSEIVTIQCRLDVSRAACTFSN